MKIDLKLTADEINFLERKLSGLKNIDSRLFDKERLIYLSILTDVSDIVSKKTNSVNGKTDIFESKKKFKISFKYHEINVLEDFIRVFSQGETDPYNKNLSIKIFSQINQKIV